MKCKECKRRMWFWQRNYSWAGLHRECSLQRTWRVLKRGIEIGAYTDAQVNTMWGMRGLPNHKKV